MLSTTMTEPWRNSQGGRGRPPPPLHPPTASSSGASALYHHPHMAGDQQHPPQRQMRSSLGQLIERSTSAPPPTSSTDGSNYNEDDYAVAENMWSSTAASPMPSATAASSSVTTTSGYDESSVLRTNGGGSTSPPGVGGTRGGGNTSVEEAIHNNTPFGRTLLIQQTMDQSGRATAPSTYWEAPHQHNQRDTNILDFGGRRSAEPSTRSPPLGGFEEEVEGGFLAESLGLGLQRSRSAAPSFGGLSSAAPPHGGGSSSNLGPPPGLPHLEPIPRPASAAAAYMSAASGGAVRPAAKTLMDLIQEDMPGEEQASNEADNRTGAAGTNGVVQSSSYLTGNAPAMVPQQQSQPPSQQPQTHQAGGLPPHLIPQTSNSPQGMFQPSSQVMNGYPTQQQSRAPLPQSYNSNMDALNYGMQNMNMQNNANNNANQIYMEQRSQMPQRYAQTGYDGGNNGNMNNGYGGLNSPQMRLPNQPPQMLQLQQAPQQQQQQQQQQLQNRLYYQQAPQPTIEVQAAPRLQAQILPNGQTVYVQAAPQPAHNMGYTFTPAAAPAAPPAQLYQRSDGQYVSVVPVQQQQQQQQQQPSPSPQTMTFWQADGTTGQAVLVTGGSGAGATLTAAVPHGLLHHRDVPTTGPGRGGGRQGRGGAGGGGRRGRNDRHSGRRGDGKGGNAGMASPLLEEFRSNKNRQWSVAHIEGYVVEFCQDQNGSRFIQQRLEMGDLGEQGIVMREVLPSIRRLRNDVFGNYVIQKLLDFGTAEVRSSIRDTLQGEMMELSLQMYGCRVVQKALETLPEEDLSRLLQEFHHNVLSCIYDQNGNHVIQKCIEVLNTRAKRSMSQSDKEHAESLQSQLNFIISDVVVNAASLSCHPYGCRVLQRILEHCDEDTKNQILDQVQPSHKRLLDDQYGNYVIQHVLQFGRTSDRDSILQIVVDAGLLGLSRQKFASNVVEKLLKYGNSNHRRAIAAEMLHRVHDASIANQSPEGTSVVLLMVRDAYANYVVQTTLDVAPESEEKSALLRELKAHADELKNYTFAKHIVSKLASMP